MNGTEAFCRTGLRASSVQPDYTVQRVGEAFAAGVKRGSEDGKKGRYSPVESNLYALGTDERRAFARGYEQGWDIGDDQRKPRRPS